MRGTAVGVGAREEMGGGRVGEPAWLLPHSDTVRSTCPSGTAAAPSQADAKRMLAGVLAYTAAPSCPRTSPGRTSALATSLSRDANRASSSSRARSAAAADCAATLSCQRAAKDFLLSLVEGEGSVGAGSLAPPNPAPAFSSAFVREGDAGGSGAGHLAEGSIGVAIKSLSKPKLLPLRNGAWPLMLQEAGVAVRKLVHPN